MKSRLFFCYGIRKSGSTLAFELTKGLLEELGHPQTKLSLPIFGNANVNFINHQKTQFLMSRHTDKILKRIEPGKILAIKTHGPPSTHIKNKLAEGNFLAQINLRDPRDITLSLIDAGNRSRKRGKGAFKAIDSVEAAVNNIKEQFPLYDEWKNSPNVLTSTYDSVAFNSEHYLEMVGSYLGYSKDELPNLTSIVKRVNKKAFTQLNIGIPSRHRKQLTVYQTAHLTQVYKEELGVYFDKYLDEIDQSLLESKELPIPPNDDFSLYENIDRSIVPLASSAVKRKAKKKSQKQKAKSLESTPQSFIQSLFKKSSAPTANTVTQKTFVVLGCPRGGTSLIAGSLARAGVYIGEFKTKQYEDPEFKIRPKFKHLALNQLNPIISNRNKSHPFWGWKVPNNIYYIDRIKHLLINPEFLFVYRDAEAIARSSAKHDGKDWNTHSERLLKVARNHTSKVKAFESKIGKKAHVFQLEDIQKYPEKFVNQLLAITHPLKGDKQELLNFINPNGGYV